MENKMNEDSNLEGSKEAGAVDEEMEAVESSTASGDAFAHADTVTLAYADDEARAPPSLRLVTDPKALNLSLNVIRFAVFADSVTAYILDPNFAFMALPDAHPDSFPDTKPFGVTAATYFLAMTALLGAALSSTVVGSISDRIGRKPCLLACLGVGAVGAVVTYIARDTFWGFSVANFSQGLFAASAPVAMAYVSDVMPTRKQKDAEIGILVALSMLGITGGGICAILMESQGLFTPLFIGASLNVVATAAIFFYVIEPKHINVVATRNHKNEEDDEDAVAPTEIDNRVLGNIVVGALLDNIGSAGLLPLAMAPLALKEFYIDFVVTGEDPIMTQSAFKWISVMVALTIIPGAGFSQVVFDRIGPAAACVAGNVATAILTIAVLYIATAIPASTSSYAAFIIALYVGFPFTVLSQLSTGPMLDTLAPVHRRGYVQGLNISCMNFASALAPYLLGEMADNVGIKESMWACIGVSFLAALVNVPLIFTKVLQRAPPKAPRYARALQYEDEDIIQRAMNGEWVPAEQLELLNDKRMKNGDPFLIIPYRPYAEDKKHLRAMKRQAKNDFMWLRHYFLEMLQDPDLESIEARQALLEQMTASRASPEQRQELAQGLSTWFAEYLMDNGYWIDDSPILYKQMIMSAFPPLFPGSDKELTVDNIEEMGINYVKLLNQYLDETELSGATKAFAGSFVSR